jgi:hypothetical protein
MMEVLVRDMYIKSSLINTDSSLLFPTKHPNRILDYSAFLLMYSTGPTYTLRPWIIK